jgi:hypothetical protein
MSFQHILRTSATAAVVSLSLALSAPAQAAISFVNGMTMSASMLDLSGPRPRWRHLEL